MNCEKCKDILIEYLEDLLDAPARQEVEEHLKTCPACQAEADQMMRLHDRLVSNGENVANRDIEDDVLNLIIREQKKRLHEATTTASRSLGIRRTIMKSPFTKLAAAAVLAIAAIVCVTQIGGSGPALADVLDKVEQVPAFMYKMTMKMTGAMAPGMPEEVDMNGEILICDEYGMKMTMNTSNLGAQGQETTQEVYIIPDEKLMIQLMPDQKRYMRMEFEDDLIDRMKKQNNDPREMIKQMLDAEYTELGKSEIDGIEVEGFETTDPKIMAGMASDIKMTLWVDVKTWMPVLCEMEVKMNETSQMTGVIHDFDWNVTVTKDSFRPVIPEDYTALPTDGMKMPGISEEGAIEGFKFFAEIFGKYPENLNMMTLMQDFAKMRESENLTEAGKKLFEDMKQRFKDQGTQDMQGMQDEVLKQTMEIMKPVQSLAMFYMALMADEKEPVYHGKTVGPEDIDQVLLEWKESDYETRVIYADLSAETIVTGEAPDAGVVEEIQPQPQMQ